ncbi:MAG TPA: transaldolase [Chromatiales bacterium]|jgi:transaldolase|nr:transaldolase [Chromatiaceae bacterium]HIB83086.1 transaldolase [Chromatiaceae bacterium]HIN83194.1 transaldolase [Chromatiales bacterium]HIO53615.1 transaldolase [Chromatiales bacterium]
MNPLKKLHQHGQSVWYDNIDRAMLTGGALQRMVDEEGVRGVTSNPSIFQAAISGSSDYDQSIASMLKENPTLSPRSLFFELAIEDIRAAADVLRPIYDESGGVDGMVSLEVSPDLAYDTSGTIEEARDLWRRLDRPNVMIKVPGTAEGIPAFETLTADGINVNVTLLFSVERYQECVEAYLSGLEKRVVQGRPIEHIASVASFFISRVDVAVDSALTDCEDQATASPLQGKIAIANAKLAYQFYEGVVNSERFSVLGEAGAHLQRLLWASTGTKNAAYSDVLYVETLIGKDTVNTMPPATYQNFLHHGIVATTLADDVDSAGEQVSAVSGLGVDLDAITETLEEQGVSSFEQAFTTLLEVIDTKAHDLVARSVRKTG